ncbi:DUF4158 domain-containing protein [Streptomyces sp. NPDC056983]|uniref:DUF4158 domain-containing protein n=1 Tax=Streptomyces sp. NPDC056983 TaxID=3345987 RepID=UPI0036335BF4
MPTKFLSEEQRRRFGHFTEDPDKGQLAESFLLDQTARRRAMAARGARNRIGWAVQLGTIRYLGTFVNRPGPEGLRWETRDSSRPVSFVLLMAMVVGGVGSAGCRWNRGRMMGCLS